MKNMDFIIFGGHNLVQTISDHGDMAAAMVACGIKEMVSEGIPMEKFDDIVKKAKRMYEKKIKGQDIPWDYEDAEFMKRVYEATRIYLEGLMLIWDCAGEGAYKHSDEDRAFRDLINPLFDQLQQCKKNLRREERLKKKGVTADGGAGAAADA